ncbi:MAG: AbrB/MazE/SpoVT family DNA-binding domain-containing protein [Verrucomicrobia bacterium]|nr:AbrB/MazE/SpoVT family DNA-binding domain-containing protein [Verrucomicrobiota bacterium]MBU1908580.1 AbrB/MazE/SpoVT family DNA-binding domain-containing protein [Verrucomicrobiota bacterium]
MPTITVSAKGWVVIPAAYRRKYGVTPGSAMEIVDYGGGMSLVPAFRYPVREAQGLLKGSSSLTSALLRERARERKREAKR